MHLGGGVKGTGEGGDRTDERKGISWRGGRESNPRNQFGRLRLYH